MDKIDNKIIEELKQDSRKTFTSIAKNLGVKTQTVIVRYNKLKEKGIILACTISVDPAKLGYEGLASLLINTKREEKTNSTLEQLLTVDDLFLISKALGDFDFKVAFAYRNSKDLFIKIQKIKRLPNIDKVLTSITLPMEIPYPLTKSTINTSLLLRPKFSKKK
jgi:DNA-binding Lrp family transcriptional regulator